MCIDYRGLNEVTRTDSYPLPRVDNTLDENQESIFNNHIDLASSVCQVRVREEDIHKTAFQTLGGMMEWIAMPFVYCSSPGTYQHMINDIMRYFSHKSVDVCLDDVCVCNRTLGEHLEHLRLVLQRFKEEDLKLRFKEASSVFMRRSTWAKLCRVVKLKFYHNYVSTKEVEAAND
jgi:hypothetical protein